MMLSNPCSPRYRHICIAISLTVLVGMVSAAIPAPGQKPTQPVPTAQTMPTQKQAFEVASIRPLDPNAGEPATPPQRPQFPTNRITMPYTGLTSLICLAYGVDYHRVSGQQDWFDSQLYSLSAKVEGDALLTREQMQPLLQNLLQERFHLAVHREPKLVSGYALVIAKGGPKLQPSKNVRFHGMIGEREIQFWNQSLADFATAIANPVGRPVVDKTGLLGTYDLDLKFAPTTGPLGDDPRDPNRPDIFTAVQEQLGLKLVPQKVPIETLVIDQVDKIPIEN